MVMTPHCQYAQSRSHADINVRPRHATNTAVRQINLMTHFTKLQGRFVLGFNSSLLLSFLVSSFHPVGLLLLPCPSAPARQDTDLLLQQQPVFHTCILYTSTRGSGSLCRETTVYTQATGMYWKVAIAMHSQQQQLRISVNRPVEQDSSDHTW